MSKLLIKKGTQNKIGLVFIQDTSSSEGAGLTGLIFSNITWYVFREGDTSPTQITPVNMTLPTWTEYGFKEIHATNMAGWYAVGFSDASLADGADYVGMALFGATNMAPVSIEIQLTALGLSEDTPLVITDFSSDGSALSVTSGTVDADVVALGTSTSALAVLAAMYGGTIATGTVNAVTDNGDFTLTSTDLTTNDNDYDDMWLVLLDNNNKFVPRAIGTYTGSTKRVQFTGSGMQGDFPQTVVAGDAFAILAGIV